jgi:hypothetical protein
VLVGWRSVSVPLTLPCNTRWIVSTRKKSERKGGHGSVKKARRAKKAYARGGEKALMKAKWPRLTHN